MIRRRSALSRMALGILGSVWAFISCAPLRRDSPYDAKGQPRMRQLAQDLEQDLSALSRRDYSEQGIPVFLVGENLPSDNESPDRRRRSEAANTILVEVFRRHAEAWQQMNPDTKEADVSKLIEVLAERDFGMTLKRPKR